jgi:hypothetical protein
MARPGVGLIDIRTSFGGGVSAQVAGWSGWVLSAVRRRHPDVSTARTVWRSIAAVPAPSTLMPTNVTRNVRSRCRRVCTRTASVKPHLAEARSGVLP